MKQIQKINKFSVLRLVDEIGALINKTRSRIIEGNYQVWGIWRLQQSLNLLLRHFQQCYRTWVQYLGIIVYEPLLHHDQFRVNLYIITNVLNSDLKDKQVIIQILGAISYNMSSCGIFCHSIWGKQLYLPDQECYKISAININIGVGLTLEGIFQNRTICISIEYKV